MRFDRKLAQMVILLVTLLGLSVALISCATNSNGANLGGSKRTDFNVKCTADGMREFVEIVCKNVEGETEIVDSHIGQDTWGYNFWVEVAIKLKGKVSEDATIVFYNRDDSDTASKAGITIFDPNSENEYNCKKELILALERALSGKTMANEYLTTYYEAKKLAYAEESIVAEYWLTDELFAVISAHNSGHMSWTVEYDIMTSDEYVYYVMNSK